MKILHIHKYFNKMRSGGSITAFFETKKLLERKGHNIVVFSMKNKDNEPSEYSEYFAEHFDVNEPKTFLKKAELVPKVIYNKDAQKKLDMLLTKLEEEGKKPDVAHLHDIHHYITPSIFPVLKKHGIPFILKLSDYKLICPSYLMFVKGDVCTRCRGGKYYNALLQKCLKDSRVASAIISVEAYFHAFKKSFDAVDYFVAPSEFMKEMCVSFGIDPDRILIRRNVLNFDGYEPKFEKKKYGLYAGRLSREKGLLTLFEAMKSLKKQNKLNGFYVKIMGEGPQEEELQSYIEENDLGDVIKMIGFRKKGEQEWTDTMRDASFSVLPSIWYDNSPVAISESMAFGTPVIVSDRGGTKEMIEDGKSGLVFKAKNVEDLSERMLTFIEDVTLAGRMGRKAVNRVHVINDEEQYYEDLMGIYEKAMKKK